MTELERIVLSALESCKKATQKQIPQEVNLVVEEHFIPNCPFPQQIPKGWACPVCGCEVDDDAHYCKYCGQAICND